MLNLDMIAALINARSNLLVKIFKEGDLDVTPNEALVTGYLDTLPDAVTVRAFRLSLKAPVCAGQS